MSKKTAAKTIRVITIPPLLVTALLVFLYLFKNEIFTGIPELVFAILFLAVIPTLAYPIQFLIPGLKEKGRKCQRTLAFIMSIIGYTGGVIYAFAKDVSWELKFIFLTYLLSVIMLTVLNKVFHLRASGHSCGVLGPLILAVYYLGWLWVIPCAVTVALVMWSSLYLTRHTPGDLFFGGLSAMAAFTICFFL